MQPDLVKRIPKEEIETPALIIDLDMMERNIQKMADLTKSMGVQLRPHIKTHKCPTIAHMQMAAGAIGIACANLGEAEVMVKAGLKEILITRMVVGPEKVRRLMGLAKQANIMVATDSFENVEELAAGAEVYNSHLGVIIEINVGQNRCGMEPASEEVLQLAKKINATPGLEFMGLQGYEGHLVLIPETERRSREVRIANERVVSTRKILEQNGIEVKIVTGGGTGSCEMTGGFPGMTEIQPGSYPTMDAAYHAIMGQHFEPALTLLTTVISRPTKDRAVVDAGGKALTGDYGPAKVLGVQGAEYRLGGDEYGIIDLKNSDRDLKIGEKIELHPTHGCTTVNLNDVFYGVRNGYLEIVLPIAARGRTN